MSIKLTLRQMEAFVAVARTLSFSQAAAQLHLSQPALSDAVRKLEDAVGGRLLDRDTRNVALTPLGIEVLTTAERLLDDFESALTGVRAFLDGRRGRVAVAASPSISAGFLPDVVAAFQRSHPLVDIRICDALSDEVVALVRAGKVDIGLAPEPALIEDDLAVRRLFRDRLVLLLRKDHELARRSAAVTWSALAPFRLVALKNTSSVRHLMEQTYAQKGLELQPAFEVEYPTTLIGFVSRGLGIGVLPYSLVPPMPLRELTYRRIGQPEIQRTLCVITRRSRTPSPAAEAFIGTCTGKAAARRATRPARAA